MYATAHRVRSAAGEEGINGSLHAHGRRFPWPAEPWRLPELDPGEQVWSHIELPPGGNRVRSYLDVLCPDDTPPREIDEALTTLWIDLVAEEAEPLPARRELRNPVVYPHGQVVLRYGVELGMAPSRASELGELRHVLTSAIGVFADNERIRVYLVNHAGRTLVVLPEVFHDWNRTPSKQLRSMSDPTFVVPRGTSGEPALVHPFADHDWGSSPG